MFTKIVVSAVQRSSSAGCNVYMNPVPRLATGWMGDVSSSESTQDLPKQFDGAHAPKRLI